MDCFEKAAMEKVKGMEAHGPKMLIIKLKMPSKSEYGSEYGSEEEDTGDMPSGPEGYGSGKLKAIFDAVNEAVGMKHEWTPEIEKKLSDKLGMMED